ncbi:unnamed protein product [Dovyalis caffra]|uniref:Bromo domain-containing protein n=1 Tax=Dovyalis caffra TaxID=77055 RepID=A0AAV1SWV6_9ROSI|nr:unnamed protein product [Dovyalis caffra]
MARKKKRANRKITKEKPSVVDSNEQAFLNFVDQNAKQNSECNEVVDQNAGQNSRFDEFSVGKFIEIDSGSESSSSAASSSGNDGSFHVDSGDEPAFDGEVQKSVKKRGRPPKKGKALNKAVGVQDKSSKVLRSSSRKGKHTDMPPQGPTYNKEELKSCFATLGNVSKLIVLLVSIVGFVFKVIKKILEMNEAKSFNSPVDPVSLGIHVTGGLGYCLWLQFHAEVRVLDVVALHCGYSVCVQDYFDVVDTPMDFGTIFTNLQNGVKYLNAEDVYKDVQYIWQNCLKYNKKGDYIVYLMKRVKKKFMKYWMAAGLKNEILMKTSGTSFKVLHCSILLLVIFITLLNVASAPFIAVPTAYNG